MLALRLVKGVGVDFAAKGCPKCLEWSIAGTGVLAKASRDDADHELRHDQQRKQGDGVL